MRPGNAAATSKQQADPVGFGGRESASVCACVRGCEGRAREREKDREGEREREKHGKPLESTLRKAMLVGKERRKLVQQKVERWRYLSLASAKGKALKLLASAIW